MDISSNQECTVTKIEVIEPTSAKPILVLHVPPVPASPVIHMLKEGEDADARIIEILGGVPTDQPIAQPEIAVGVTKVVRLGGHLAFVHTRTDAEFNLRRQIVLYNAELKMIEQLQGKPLQANEHGCYCGNCPAPSTEAKKATALPDAN